MDLNSFKEILGSSGSALFYTPPRGRREVSFLFTKPSKILTASDKPSFKKIITRAEHLVSSGWGGFILADYELIYLLEKKLTQYNSGIKEPVAKIYLYKKDDILQLTSTEIPLFEKDYTGKYSVSGFHFNTSRKEYISSVRKIKDYILEGDTYQVNYTVKGKFRFRGDPLAFFSVLAFNQSAQYSAFINTGDKYLISLAPELFFSLDEDEITTRPMKGTRKRDVINETDRSGAEFLRSSEKERSENLMIVDLLRNDLGRISEYGTVKTEKLFEVEFYESLYQMVSTIRGKLLPGMDLYKIFTNIFPCGSVTGAPKLRTMEIIKELEKENRGIYTGTIGLLLPEKKVFNVAIRTIEIDRKSGQGKIGLGSGIVWDSNPEDEYNEVLLKSSFLTSPDPPYELLETMLMKDGNILFRDEHINRLLNSAGALIFNFSRKEISSELKKLSRNYPDGEFRIRLLLNKPGKIKTEVKPLKAFDGEVKVIISRKKISSDNKFLYHKTTFRPLYNSEYLKYSKEGYFDVLFLNERDELCEGSISNIFIRKNKEWFTPAVSSGLLPGIFRNFLLNNLPAVEKTLFLVDLSTADEVTLVNSLRGKTTVSRIFYGKKDKSVR